ncbi:DUF6476 family protein [Roseobacter sp. OBYS 0001]|uniref:DUF6476 family protein n=1 Tax=Roseobacter sp. OBYS 0001 TaxID=882651 RepID=UPI001BC4D17A|nr:DUF6476 family protein [Roseobacter sp. OBYS 0001]GIT86953.1 hypothetical protein ROBYS_19690 [Roseobacter sp. OBYS 0001]
MMTPELTPDREPEEPANLKFLRRLVTVLTATMIAGVLLIVGLIVIRFYDVPPVLPQNVSLPDGAQAVSFTQGPDWYAIVTDDNRILIYDRITGALKQTVTID